MKKFILLLVICIGAISCTKKETGGYLFVTFRGESTAMAEQVYFMLSENGRDWQGLNRNEPVLVSMVGEKGVRDPYIIRAYDNSKFYLIATDLSIHLNSDWQRAQTSASQSIVVWESSDLVKWSEPRLVKVAPDHAGNTWAPEVIYDQDVEKYMVFWASKTSDDHYAKHRIWAAHTKDFKQFDKPFVYIEKPNTVIDTTIIKDGSIFYRFTKDEEHKAITLESSTHLMSGWKSLDNFSLKTLRGYEGPTSFMLDKSSDQGPAKWQLLLDFYSEDKGYQSFESSDLSSGQFKQGDRMNFPFHPVRHGSVMKLTKEEYQTLKSADNDRRIKVGI